MLRDIEASLEAALTPNSGMNEGRSASLLTSFESEASQQVRAYLEQLIEETTPEKAEELRLLDKEILERENTLKVGRDEIDKERRMQDAMLKDARSFQGAGGAEQGEAIGRSKSSRGVSQSRGQSTSRR